MAAAALELEEAQARLLALAPALGVQQCPAEQALGRYLAEDLVAARTQPSADLSAMDGYAIGEGTGPWTRIGESSAGSPFGGKIGAGETVRISTGAHVPDGADRILIQENASVEGDVITLAAELPTPQKHVRLRGFDFAEGDVVLEKGTQIGAAQLALALSAGHASLPVTRPPKVAILDSGDELAATPEDCAPGQIPASNGAMLQAMIAPLGCEIMRHGPVPDDRNALADALAKAADADLVITSGGASVGDHDLIKPALEAWGAQLTFWKVAIKPGKPLIVATKGKRVVIGLPGNPVSSYVTAFLFVLPLIRKAMGSSDPLPRKLTLPLSEALKEGGVRREFLRGSMSSSGVKPVDEQDSSALAALCRADCLIERMAAQDSKPAGAQVQVYPL